MLDLYPTAAIEPYEGDNGFYFNGTTGKMFLEGHTLILPIFENFKRENVIPVEIDLTETHYMKGYGLSLENHTGKPANGKDDITLIFSPNPVQHFGGVCKNLLCGQLIMLPIFSNVPCVSDIDKTDECDLAFKQKKEK